MKGREDKNQLNCFLFLLIFCKDILVEGITHGWMFGHHALFSNLDLSFVFYSFCSKDLLNFYLPFFIVKICDTWLNVLY